MPSDLANKGLDAVPLAVDRDAALERCVDELFQEHFDIVRQVAMFKDIDPNATEPPEEFIDRFGSMDAARKAYRLALSGWMPTKDAPSGAHFAYKVVTGVLKAMAEARGAGQKPLNVQVAVSVNNTAEKVDYVSVEVED